MDIIKHTINWCKGEIFEGRMILLFGILCLLITFSFWKFGAMPSGKAFIIPLLIVSLLLIGIGISMNFSNQKRMIEYKAAYTADPQQFVKNEIQRTDSFIRWYPAIRYIGATILIIGLLIFMFTVSPLWKSISLCLMVVAIAVFVIDYFSEERAVFYHQQLMRAIKA